MSDEGAKQELGADTRTVSRSWVVVASSVLRCAAYLLASYLLWQLALAANVVFLPTIPVFVVIGSLIWILLSDWVLGGTWRRSGPRPSASALFLFAACAITLIVTVFVLQGAAAGLANIAPLQAPTELSRISAALFSVYAMVLVGCTEEVAFRGVLQPALVKTCGTAAGIAVTAVTFVVWHAPLPAFGQQWLGYLVAGMLTGFALEATGSIALSVLIHGSVNLIMNAAVVVAGGLSMANLSVRTLTMCGVTAGLAAIGVWNAGRRLRLVRVHSG